MRTVSAAVLLFLVSSAWGLVPGEHVGNFRLFDAQGGSHHLYYFSDKDAIVLVAQDTSCAAATRRASALEKLQAEHGEQVQFFYINPTQQRGELTAVGSVPVLVDDAQLVGRTLDLNRAGEALVINPKTWSLAYRGDAGKALSAALDDVLAGKPVSETSKRAKGCDIAYAPHDGSAISYADRIVPILSENCVSCHRPGGIGPWAMTDYNMVRGFSLMIREVLMTRRMPPWHADPTVGHWANDRSLSREDLQTLVSWIDAGAPRGEGEDLLAQHAVHKPLWGQLGEPDLVIDIPPTDVPATGVVDYQYKLVKNPLDKDVWVRASQIVPGERAVLHHVITRFGELIESGRRKGRVGGSIGGGLAGYVPGAEARPLPEGTGTFLPAGATIEFQMHYTTSGVATTDHSKLGIYFHEAEPEHKIHGMILANGRIRIPPHAKNHQERVAQAFETDVLVYSILPHSHYRGKAARFVAQYPDGTEEVLLNVPNYDFNWQTTYLLDQPKFMPAGTRIVYTNWWDNSAQNPANPDPTKEVRWGQQSYEEMIFGAISYREVKPSEGDQLAGSE